MSLEPETLKRLRRAAQISQEQLAQALGVSRQTVSHWENGHSQPDEAVLRSIAQILEVSPSALGLAEDAPPVPETTAEPTRPRRRLWLLLAAALALTGLALCLLLTQPQEIVSDLTPADFQVSQENGWLSMYPLNARPARRTKDGKDDWRLGVVLEPTYAGNGIIQEIRIYHFTRDLLGRTKLEYIYKVSWETLKHIWGSSVLKANTQYSFYQEIPAGGRDYGFGVEAVVRDPKGQPLTLRLWAPVP